MRFATIQTPRGPRHARLDGDVAELLDRAPWLGGGSTGERVPFSAADLACPVAPSKILCIGRNYAAHARELGHDIPAEPLLFLKAPSALLPPGGVVVRPPESERVEHEAELALVIGRRCKSAPREDALSYVFGYAAACDVTARDLQKKDVQFTRAKSFDTFCPVGPFIETEIDPARVQVRGKVNGQVRQDGATSLMLFDVPTVIAYASRMMTLEPGDVILTGTPEGVGPLLAGDVLEVEIAPHDHPERAMTLRVSVANTR